jgi:putative SOS response-associated peptidase YedK
MRDGALFSVAGLWREWAEPVGSVATLLTQITINTDEHPLMKRFHRTGDEKRALVVIQTEKIYAG